jgi:thiol-disulfide isomerase/thioredoxin
VLNASYTSASLAYFPDKLILIDFWATWCGSCIKEFPKMDSLQKRFKDRLQFFLASSSNTGDDSLQVQSFFAQKRTRSGKKYTLPVIMHAAELENYFPHQSLPHTVWIYRDTVRAISFAYDVTAANIQSVLNSQPLVIAVKKDQMDFDFKQPLLENGNGGNADALVSRSLFTHYLGVVRGASGTRLMADGKLKRLFYINQPVLGLYASAYHELPANRLILDSTLSPELIHPFHDQKWKTGHYFSYELTVPVSATRKEMYVMMQQDLDKQFRLNSRVEKRLVDGYQLVRTGNNDSLFQSGNNNIAPCFYRTDSGIFMIRRQPVSALLQEINQQRPGEPLHPLVVDKTGYTGLLDVDLDLPDLQDITVLKGLLHAYGLDIIPAKMELPMLVIAPSSIYQKSN